MVCIDEGKIIFDKGQIFRFPSASRRDAGLKMLCIVETCRHLSLPVRDYLGSVLPGLADFPVNRAAELTPTAWDVRN